MGSRLHPVQVKRLREHGLDTGDDHGQIGWFTPGHDGIDGEFLKRSATVFGRDIADKLLRIVVANHALYQFWRRWHDGEAIGPAAIHEEFDGGYGVIDRGFSWTSVV